MGHGGNIRVTPEQLQSIAGQLNSGASNIESINAQRRELPGHPS